MSEGGLWNDAWRRLGRNRAALVAAGVLVAIVALSLLGPLAGRYAIDHVDWTLSPLASPPSLANGHWFGTDSNGRDLFARVWSGTRVSLLVAVLATVVSLVIGVAWGATAGYLGGRVDGWMMRFVDVLYALPYMLFVIILTVVFGRSLWLIFLAIGAVGWLTMARIVRGQAMALRQREFIDAAVTLGLPARRIIARALDQSADGILHIIGDINFRLGCIGHDILSFYSGICHRSWLDHSLSIALPLLSNAGLNLALRVNFEQVASSRAAWPLLRLIMHCELIQNFRR